MNFKTISILSLLFILGGASMNYSVEKSIEETNQLLVETSKYIDNEETSTIVSKIGDVCDDQNKFTQDDLYVDTVGTCVGGLYKESKLAKKGANDKMLKVASK